MRKRKIYVCLWFSLLAITSIACSNQQFSANSATNKQQRILSNQGGIPQQIEEISNKITDIEAKLSKAVVDIDALKKEIETIKATVSTQQVAIDNLSAKVDALETASPLHTLKYDLQAYLGVKHGTVISVTTAPATNYPDSNHIAITVTTDSVESHNYLTSRPPARILEDHNEGYIFYAPSPTFDEKKFIYVMVKIQK